MPQGRDHESGRASKADLKRREYRDEKGEIHHHTHAYMAQHEGGSAKAKSSSKAGGARGESRSFEPRDRRAAKTSGAKTGSGKTHAGKSGGARTTTDHDEIRRWAEAHGGRPAAVARTHSDEDVGIIRIMFPDAPNSEHGALTAIGWDEFFEEFEARKLALLYESDSMFSKIIGRDTAEQRAHGDNKAAR